MPHQRQKCSIQSFFEAAQMLPDRPRKGKSLFNKSRVASLGGLINNMNAHLPTIAGEPHTSSLWQHFCSVTETTAYFL